MLAPADPAFVARLAASLPPGRLREAEPRDLTEPRGRWQGRRGPLAMPRDAAEVATILHACAAARVGVVARAGGTGLVGGAVMPEGPLPLILSVERMAGLRAVWPEENVLVAGAGTTLAEVRAAAAAAGREFPLSIASEGSAMVGGFLSTNAGGVNVLRYGNARDLCLGLEAVLADGSVWHGLGRLRKDNTGYDLRDLLIGAEGTLGIITAASLRLVAPAPRRGTAFVTVRDPAAALRMLALAEARLPGLVTAFELIGRAGLDFLAATMPEVRQPFAVAPQWMVLAEIGLPAAMEPLAELAALHEAGVAEGLAGEAVVAASGHQRAAFWALREAIPEANRRIGAIASHDVALPLSEIAGFIAAADAAVAALGPFRVNCFGHLGDGNLHYNVFPPPGGRAADHAARRGEVQRAIHDLVHARGGSVSAEHGIGRLKTGDLLRYGDPARIGAMRAIKTALDPLGILNPGAVLAGG